MPQEDCCDDTGRIGKIRNVINPLPLADREGSIESFMGALRILKDAFPANGRGANVDLDIPGRNLPHSLVLNIPRHPT